MKNLKKKKTRQYSAEFLNFGFIAAPHDVSLPFCLICEQCLTNESMKKGRLETHLKTKHKLYMNYEVERFERIKEKFEKRTTIDSLFSTNIHNQTRTLEASYGISFLIAKNGKSHTIGEILKNQLYLYLSSQF